MSDQVNTLINPITKTPKEQFHELMVELFGMIENINGITEGEYLLVAEIMKKMNLNLNRLQQIQVIIQANPYYARYVKSPINYTRLTEEDKRRRTDYKLCGCGRMIKDDDEILREHLNTQVHYQGIRNKTLAAKKKSADIEFEIKRQIALESFCVNHTINSKK